MVENPPTVATWGAQWVPLVHWGGDTMLCEANGVGYQCQSPAVRVVVRLNPLSWFYVCLLHGSMGEAKRGMVMEVGVWARATTPAPGG